VSQNRVQTFLISRIFLRIAKNDRDSSSIFFQFFESCHGCCMLAVPLAKIDLNKDRTNWFIWIIQPGLTDGGSWSGKRQQDQEEAAKALSQVTSVPRLSNLSLVCRHDSMSLYEKFK
jgi:hypothetical protein